jgi:hypothetical protein
MRANGAASAEPSWCRRCALAGSRDAGPARSARRSYHRSKTLVDGHLLTSALGTAVQAEAPLRVVCFPRVEPGSGGLEVEELADPDRIVQLLAANVLRFGVTGGIVNWLGLHPDEPEPDGGCLRDLVLSMLPSVRFLRITGTFEGYTRGLAPLLREAGDRGR